MPQCMLQVFESEALCVSWGGTPCVEGLPCRDPPVPTHQSEASSTVFLPVAARAFSLRKAEWGAQKPPISREIGCPAGMRGPNPGPGLS